MCLSLVEVTMKLLGILIVTVMAVPALALELTCKNLRDNRVVLMAEVGDVGAGTDRLSRIQIRLNPRFYSLEGLRTRAIGKEIVNNRSPYKGNYEYNLVPSFFPTLRLVLPPNLKPRALAQSRIQAGNLTPELAEKQNGILQLSGRRNSDPRQSGDSFVRMNCVSE